MTTAVDAGGFVGAIPSYLLPAVAIISVGWVIVKSLYDQATSKATAAIEVTPEILAGVRTDLQRATNEARLAREEAAESRLRAEAAERARDAERELRRKLEDDFHAYRVDARKWTAALLGQLNSMDITPAPAPERFDI